MDDLAWECESLGGERKVRWMDGGMEVELEVEVGLDYSFFGLLRPPPSSFFFSFLLLFLLLVKIDLCL